GDRLSRDVRALRLFLPVAPDGAFPVLQDALLWTYREVSSVRLWVVLWSSAQDGRAIPSTRLAICHVIREPLMCMATGDATAQNLCEALRFQHSPALTDALIYLVGVNEHQRRRLITSPNSVVRGHSGPTQQQHHTGLGCAASGCAPLFATRWKR